MPIFDHNYPKTSNNKHGWNLVKYLNVLDHNRIKKQLEYLFLEHVYIKTKFILNWFKISNYFEKLLCLHNDFTAATIVKFCCTCANCNF